MILYFFLLLGIQNDDDKINMVVEISLRIPREISYALASIKE